MQITIDNKTYETNQLPNGKWTLPDEIKEMLSITCGALNIDGNRVAPTSEKDLKDIRSERPSKTSNANDYTLNHGKLEGMDRSDRQDISGRYPSQTFIQCICDEVVEQKNGKPYNYQGTEYENSKSAMFRGDKPQAPSNYNDNGAIHTNPNCPCAILDRQSGVSKSVPFSNPTVGFHDSLDRNNKIRSDKGTGYTDTGGCSKILHKCDYDEHDLYFYCPKVNGQERSKGLEFDSTGIVCYHIGICKEKNTTQEEKLATLWVDTDQSAIRVIGESGTHEKDVLLWNIVLFMKNILEKYLTENGYTTKTEINWTTELKTLNLLTLLLTKENILVAKKEKTDGISLVVNVADFFTSPSFIGQNTDTYSDNVKNAASELQLSINAKEWQSGHPTLKPISLIERVLKLFKTPNEQRILIPFAGSGSEYIGAWQAGFRDIQGCEINEEYVKIAESRIKHWTSLPKQNTLL